MTKGFLGRELPFECIVGDEPEVCENIFSRRWVCLPMLSQFMTLSWVLN